MYFPQLFVPLFIRESLKTYGGQFYILKELVELYRTSKKNARKYYESSGFSLSVQKERKKKKHN